MIKLSRTTTGSLLFLVDAILLLPSWPILLWVSRPSIADMIHPLVDARGAIYPLADLLLLFAMGLYRREAIQNTARSLSRNRGWRALAVYSYATLAALVGGGVETRLMGGWFLRGEYRFTQFSEETLLTCLCGDDFNAEPSTHTGRVVLIYRFGQATQP